MPNDERILETMPTGTLGLIPTASCMELGKKVDSYLSTWREHREHEHHNDIAFKEYHKESYIIEPHIPRFGSGEAKCVINQSVRGYDLYIMVDVTNYSMTYSLCGHTNHMSPDDHFADLKRVIAAVGGKARRITVILPFLYESRQHKRTARESLDCALALQELTAMGVDNIITFDAHDPRVQNAIPLKGFVQQLLRYFMKQSRLTDSIFPGDANLFRTAYAEKNIFSQNALPIWRPQFWQLVLDHCFSCRNCRLLISKLKEDRALLLRHLGHVLIFFFKTPLHGFYCVHFLF